MIFDVFENGKALELPCTPGGRNVALAVRGDKNAIVKEFAYFAERTCLVGIGLFAAGQRNRKLFQGAIAGGLAMELFVLGYSYYRNRFQEPPPTTPTV